ncbi:hypothetical protein PCE1_004012 [Barthelona sp. PCE]
MPRPIAKVSENFYIENCFDCLIVSAVDDSLNTQSLCLMGKCNERVIRGPDQDRYFSENGGLVMKSSLLEPSLLEPNIFYRTLGLSEGKTMIEIFEFVKGDFVFKKHFEIPFLAEVKLLNRQLMVVKSNTDKSVDVDDKECNFILEVISLEEAFTNIFCSLVKETVYFSVQNNKVHVVYELCNGFKDVIIDIEGATVSFEVNNLPLRIHAFDMTPGDHRFIVKHDNCFCSCSFESGQILFSPLNYQVPKFRKVTKIARVQDTVILAPDSRVSSVELKCLLWNFVLLNGEIFCSEYNAENGRTEFFPVLKRQFDCFFTTKCSFGFANVSNLVTLKNFPIFFDFFNNSIKVIKQSIDLKSKRHLNTQVFYNNVVEKWQYGSVWQNFEKCIVYIDGVEHFSFNKPNKGMDCYVIFNNYHFVSMYRWRKSKSMYINKAHFRRGCLDSVQVVGNRVWFCSGMKRNINVVLLSEVGGDVISHTSYCFGNNLKALEVITNPQCQDEVFVRLMNGNSNVEVDIAVIKYSIAENSLCVIEIELPLRKGATACFVDESVFVYSDLLCFCSCTTNIPLDIPQKYSHCYCPITGVALFYSDVTDLLLELCIITFYDNYSRFNVEFRCVDIAEFLSQCSCSIS